MTAREELAQSIAANLDRLFGVRDFGPATQDYVLADALLAEGWGKRRNSEAIERGARALSGGYAIDWDRLPEWVREQFRDQARTVVSAIRSQS